MILRYVAVEARDGSIFVCTQRSARNMAFQELLKLDKEVKPVCMIPGKMITVYFFLWQIKLFPNSWQ
mgnify:CR=1 FL=1